LVRRIARADRPQLVINSALGFDGDKLDFLREVGPHLVSLEVSGSFSSDQAVVVDVIDGLQPSRVRE